MKWNLKKLLKKEKNIENKLNEEIVNIEESVGFNNKWTWVLSIIAIIVVVSIFLIIHFVSGVL